MIHNKKIIKSFWFLAWDRGKIKRADFWFQVTGDSSVLAKWVRKHFGQPCSLLHRSGWVSLGLVAVVWNCLMKVPGRPSNCILQLRPVSSSLRVLSSQDLTLFGEISPLRHIFLDEFQQSWRYFCNQQACVFWSYTWYPQYRRLYAVLTCIWGTRQILVGLWDS